MKLKLTIISLLLITLYMVAVMVVESRMAIIEAAATSTSPENPNLWGTTDYVALLRREGYRVIVGSIWDAVKMVEKGKVLYVSIGPDKPYTSRETETIVRMVEAGRLNLLLADELGTINVLLERLDAPTVAGLILNSESLIVTAECLGKIVLLPKASRLQDIDGWRPICKAGDSVIAALGYIHGSSVLIVADSSIFANFMVRGIGDFKPTSSLVLELTGFVAKDVNAIVVDATHYPKTRIEAPLYAALLPIQVIEALKAFSTYIAKEATEPIVAGILAALALFTIALTARRF